MTWNVQIITHTHWDREWYLNSPYTNEWLIPFFDQLFKMMEEKPTYQFVLDGQMNMIDDYFEELQKKGKAVYPYKERIRKYSNAKRLFIGPYYLQPDWQLVSDEALVRNLTIGTKMAQDLGTRMNVGWMLDNFGQISQTAQIHKEAGLDGLYVWRGVEMDPENVQSEFLWESPDGTKLPSVYLLNSYRNVMRLAEYPDIMKKRIDMEVDKLEPFMTTKNVLMMNGYDQEIVPDDIIPYIQSGELNSEKIQVTQSNPEAYLASVLAENPELITLKGALYSGRFISVFPGVMSARMYLKQQNYQSQKLLERYVEPLAWLDSSLGGNYNHSLYESAWKLLLKNHPHDSICGVSIDDVHSDMEKRTAQIDALTLPAMHAHFTNIINRIDTSKLSDKNYFAFSSSAYPRTDVVTVEGKHYFVKSAGVGYNAIDTSVEPVEQVTRCGNVIENNVIRVIVNVDGTFDLYDKETATWYKGLGGLEESGDAGDEYNYSYPTIDRRYYSKQCAMDTVSYEETPLKVTVTLDYTMQVPKHLTPDREAREVACMAMPVRTKVTVEAGSKVVGIQTTIKNTVRDHIVRALFPTDIETDHTYAGSPFDVVKRPIYIDDYNEEDIPANVRKVIIGAREAKPNTIFLGKDFVDLNDDRHGLAVINKGLPEYTVYEDRQTIALTLFRGVEWVANEINTRIGDAGPLIYTPEAQCLREMVFEYAVYPHNGGYEEGKVVQVADQYNTELVISVTNKHEGSLPVQQTWVSAHDTTSSVKITAMKRAEQEDKLLVRLFNSGEVATECTLTFHNHVKGAVLTDFLEVEKTKLAVMPHQVSFPVTAKQIVTLIVDLEDESVQVTDKQAHADIYQVEQEVYDWSMYDTMPLVTDTEIAREQARYEAMQPQINEPLYRRTTLEARLSAILAQHRKDEQEIRELGLQLNEARVIRRVYDYIQDVLKEGE